MKFKLCKNRNRNFTDYNTITNGIYNLFYHFIKNYKYCTSLIYYIYDI